MTLSPEQRTAVALEVDRWLREHNEDACWIRGGHCRERQEAYERLLGVVARRVIGQVGWREWLEIQQAARAEIQRLCEQFRRGTE